MASRVRAGWSMAYKKRSVAIIAPGLVVGHVHERGV